MTTSSANSRGDRPVLHIDIETYSEADLSKGGVFAYCGHPAFEILLVAYAKDGEPVRLVDMVESGGELPEDLWADLIDPGVLKVAHNAAFELTAFQRYFKDKGFPDAIVPEQWACSMAAAMREGLPAALAALSEVMGLELPKMREGRALIRYFCQPCKATKANGGRTRNMPWHEPEKWELFGRYCVRDVEAEREIMEKLIAPEPPAYERRVWLLDRKINEAGVLIDRDLVDAAMEMDTEQQAKNMDRLHEITELDNPNSPARLKAWLAKRGLEVPSLTKDIAGDLAKTAEDPEVREALGLRLKLAKTSVAKYEAMDRAVNEDGRVRGLFQYYGGARTGRWAGRLVQLQNLPQNHIEPLDVAREFVKAGDAEALDLIFGNVPDVLSQLIRTAIVAPTGKKLIVADYSAIEARVIAWLAGEKWRQDVFAKDGDIYCASASQMFGVPVEKHGVNGHLRQKGKVAELALGYQGALGALKKMGGERMGLEEDEMLGIVRKWRQASPSIVALWRDMEAAARSAITQRAKYTVRNAGVSFHMMGDALVLTLRSGRCLYYRSAHIEDDEQGRAHICYMGMSQERHKWVKLETYGGKLTENLVQATARDLLAKAMLRLDDEGYKIIGHVHDEVILEADMGDTVAAACAIMCEGTSWSEGLHLNADGYETPYYKKD